MLAANPAQAQSRYSYSTDGGEVTDSQTGLVWRRCAEGMSWSGTTCSGSASLYTHEAALARAKTQSGWPLPNAKELSSLVDIGRSDLAIDPVAFPATPPVSFWTSTPYAGDPAFAWGVSFGYGSVSNSNRSGNRVRLVR